MTKKPPGFLLRLQPHGANAIQDLGESAAEAKWEGLLVCVAYATSAGVAQLVGELDSRWEGFDPAMKLFVVGLDFGLTEPSAVRELSGLPNASCRLFEARTTLSAKLRPQWRFHPKLYAFGSRESMSQSRFASGIAGSANLTAAALTSNVEAYARFRVGRYTAPGRRWIRELALAETLAKSQPEASELLLAEYEKLRPKVLPASAIQTEPIPGVYAPGKELQPAHSRALRAARCLWTQTLKIVENRGVGNPGNQIDLKRGVRAFFRSDIPLHAPVNTPLGAIDVVTAAGRERCNLRYGNSGMDKVNLPIPGDGKTPKYGHCFVLWERKADGSFVLHVQKDGKVWRRASRNEGTVFKYAGGHRSWGFFNGVF